MFLVDIVHHMWRMGGIPQELVWTVLVLIPKGTTDTRGIGLLKTLWKVVEALIDTRLRSSLKIHDVLHRFRAGKGMGTAIMEFKLTQEISSIYQGPLFLLFLDLRKTYDTVDQDCILITLEGYGAGPQLCGLLETFWGCHKVVLVHNCFHGPTLPATRGTTKVGLVSPMLFNAVVDNVIRSWLAMKVDDHRVAHDGLGETVGRYLGVFYDEDGMVGSRDSDWLQNVMNVLVGLFRRYGMAANIAKSRTMKC